MQAMNVIGPRIQNTMSAIWLLMVRSDDVPPVAVEINRRSV